MKKRFLPFSFLLAIMLLGQSITIADNGGHYVPRTSETPSADRFMSELRANQKTGLIDPVDMIKATQGAATKDGPADAPLYWISMGPDNMAGQTTAIVYDNRGTGIVYVASKGGGIFKSYNNGITWHHVASNALMASCMVQAADGTIYIGTGDNNEAQDLNGLSDLGSPAYSNSFVGTGIYKMVDEEITQIASTRPSTSETDDWSFVNGLAIVGNYLVAATDKGILSSDDKGQTWTLVAEGKADEVKVMADGTTVIASIDGQLYKGTATQLTLLSGDGTAATVDESGTIIALPKAGILNIACSANDAKVMYAACISTSGNTEGNHTGIYLTKDGCQTWKLVYPGVAFSFDLGHQLYDGYGIYHHVMTVDPTNDEIVYVGGYDLWTIQKPASDDGYYEAFCLSSGTSSVTSSNYLHVGLNAMTFNPNNSKECYVGTDGGVYKVTMGNRVISSFNCNRNYVSTRLFNVGICGQDSRVLMGVIDHGVVRMEGDPNVNTMGYSEWINPSGYDGGAFDQAYQPGPCAISTINPQSIYVSISGGNIYRSNTFGNDWVSTNFTSNLAGQFALKNIFRTPIAMLENYNDPQSHATAWYFNKGEEAVDIPAGTTVQCMSTNGYPFDHVLSATLAAGDSIEVHDPISNRMAIGTEKAVYFTRMALQYASATIWYRVTDKNFKETAASLAFSPDGNTLFMGTIKGKIYRFDNLDTAVDSTWTITTGSNAGTYYSLLIDPVEIDLGTTQCITSIAVDPRDGNKVLVTLGNYGNESYVKYSTNALSAAPQFDSKQGNLPLMPVYTAVIEMNTGHVLLGTDHGIYRTKDINGASWTADNEAMGDLPVLDLKQQILQVEDKTVVKIGADDTIVEFYPGVHNTGIIYAATYGRGVFRCENYKLSGASVPETPATAMETTVSIYPNPVRGQATVSFDVATDTNVSYKVFDLTGRLVMSQQVGRFIQGQEQQISIDMSSLSAGSYILRLEQGSQVSAVKFVLY